MLQWLNTKDISTFVMRNGGECLSGTNLYSGYKEYGESDECFDGEGCHDAMNVCNMQVISKGLIVLLFIQPDISPFLIGSNPLTSSS